MSIRLHIEHLVLEGLPVDAAQEPVLRAALEAELARRLEERGVTGLGEARAVDVLRGTELRMPRDLPAGPCGRQLGAAIYGSLTP
jgi:hypothetical protein